MDETSLGECIELNDFELVIVNNVFHNDDLMRSILSRLLISKHPDTSVVVLHQVKLSSSYLFCLPLKKKKVFGYNPLILFLKYKKEI